MATCSGRKAQCARTAGVLASLLRSSALKGKPLYRCSAARDKTVLRSSRGAAVLAEGRALGQKHNPSSKVDVPGIPEDSLCGPSLRKSGSSRREEIPPSGQQLGVTGKEPAVMALGLDALVVRGLPRSGKTRRHPGDA